MGPRIEISPRHWNRRHGGFITFHYVTRDVRIPCDGASAIKATKHFEENDAGGELDVLDVDTPTAHRGWMSMTSTGLLGISWEYVPKVRDRITLDPATGESDQVQRVLDALVGTAGQGGA